MATYMIKRFYQDANTKNEVIATGLTLAEVEAHCEDPENSSKTCTSEEGRRRTEEMGAWFDGWTKEAGSEQNTHFIFSWMQNDEFVYVEAMRIADRGDVDELREFIVTTLRGAPQGSTAHGINKAMSDDDFDLVDWAEIVSDLQG